MHAAYCKYRLIFKEPATTSRETMTYKDTYYVKVWHEERPEVFGIGECALFKGLSAEDTPDYESQLAQGCRQLANQGIMAEASQSSIRFGLETALADLKGGGRRVVYDTAWTRGQEAITINGLVWMGSIKEMQERVRQKLEQGNRCVKFKIGAQDYEEELSLLKQLRKAYSPTALEIRLDANGAFTPENALERIRRLTPLHIHSIEQPIKPRQWQEMAKICAQSAIPIALDEELIGISDPAEKLLMLQAIKPDYIILKPALCGGIYGARQWIDLAKEMGVGWWVTSALESNIGLNMLAQWVSTLGVTMPQGLGTGGLYTNNIPSPIAQAGDGLVYRPDKSWDIPEMQWNE